VTYKGIVQGKTIAFEDPLALPDGTVEVVDCGTARTLDAVVVTTDGDFQRVSGLQTED
jgi:hypothetical protein